VRAGSEIELGWSAPSANHPVGRGISVGGLIGGKVGHGQGTGIEGRLDLPEPAIERFDLIARDSEPLHEILGRLLGPLPSGDFVAGCVPLGLQVLDPDQHVPPLAIELEHVVEYDGQARIAPPHQAGPAAGRILAKALDVDHT
jgi:hypothetical protein